jgi:hypothetical protein
MASIVPGSNTELNSDVDSQSLKDTSPASPSSNTNTADSTETTDLNPSNNDDYPEQRHAGALGYGPNYHRRTVSNKHKVLSFGRHSHRCVNNQSAGEKFQGIKEQLKGKIMGKPDLVEHGRLRRTDKLREQEENVWVFIIPLYQYRI